MRRGGRDHLSFFFHVLYEDFAWDMNIDCGTNETLIGSLMCNSMGILGEDIREFLYL